MNWSCRTQRFVELEDHFQRLLDESEQLLDGFPKAAREVREKTKKSLEDLRTASNELEFLNKRNEIPKCCKFFVRRGCSMFAVEEGLSWRSSRSCGK